MEDDEETSKVHEYSLQEAEDSAIGDKPLEIEVLENTEQCQILPELGDSQLVAAESMFVGKADEGEQALTDEMSIEGTEMQTETKVKELEDDVKKVIPELKDSRPIGVGSPIIAKDEESDEVIAEEEEKSMAHIDIEIETAKSSEGKSVEESQLGDAAFPITAKDNKDDEAVANEEVLGTKIEMQTEALDGIGEESAPELEDVQHVGVESPLASKEGEGEGEREEEEEEEEDEEEEEEEELMAVDEAPILDPEMEMETNVAEIPEAAKGGGDNGGKRKRGRSSKALTKAPVRKTIEEDVCFICFDGGDLVLCDRRGCPKAYHPSCVNRDEAFFRAKGRWNCGWHLCSNCQKNAYYMCYTCTFSLCKGCIKDAVILCVRGNKGFCETCMRTVMLIESNEHRNKEAQVDFDDKSSWEYLFKDYWIDLKAKLSLSSNELTQAKNPWKGSDLLVGKQELPEDLYDTNYDRVSGSDSSENVEAAKPKRRKAKKRSKSIKGANVPNAAIEIYAGGTSTFGDTEWASKELLEFVMHMKDGDRSILSQFDVQALLLEYIKRNELRDPRRKSQIICDSRLENLFGKARVGHFEMLKLLESHFLIKEDSQREDTQGTVVDTEVNQLETDGNTDPLLKGGKDKRRKTRKRGDDRGPQSNLDDYAAINNHNINLIYLRRKLIEDLLEDIEKFHDKVVGTFVRIRISGSNQKQDIYRLVQVVGTSKASEPYKVGKRATDIVLEILNLNKTEIVSIDTVSNQEFTEDECKRLRQSIKCGLINRLTVGDIVEKATELQVARVNDWLETEIVRLSHLRDRASEKGRRKELRECVEKLQLLKTPEERRRRLEEIPEIQADPNMDPSHESEEEDSVTEDNKQEIFMRARSSSFGRKGREPISPRSGSFSSQDSWSGMRKSSNQNWELNRTMSSKNYLKGDGTTPVGEILNETSWNQNRDQDGQLSKNLEKLNSATDSETGRWNDPSVARSESLSGVVAETAPASLSARLSEAAAKISETDKMWHYKDPSGKVQGPFSIVQLRKWSNTGYFPADLRIWRTTEKQDDSILLTDVLAGKFQKELPSADNSFTKAQTVVSSHLSSTHAGKPSGLSSQNVDPSYSSGWASSSVEVSKLSTEQWVSGNRNDSSNLPSPTPKQNTQGWNGGQASENKWSPNSVPVQQVGTVLGSSSYPGGNLAFQSLSVATPDNGQLTHSASPSSINASGSKEHTALESRGTLVRTSVLNSGAQLTRGSSENDALSSRTGITPAPAPAPNPNKGIILGSTNALPNFQPTGTDGSHGVHPSVETQSWGSGSIPKTEMVAQCPAPGGESQAWGSSAPQKLEPNSSIPAPGGPGQPAAYGQWGSVLSAVQNPSGNLHNPGFSGLPPPDPWRPQIPASQSNMQPPAPPNVPWGIGITENNAFAPGPRPDNPNAGWGLMPGNANMAWGGPVLGSTNMNSGAIALGPTPGNANLGWVPPAGNPGATIQGPVSGNPGWIAPTGNPSGMVQGPTPGNANPGWAIPTGNQGGSVQGPSPGNGNPGWVAPTGNPGATIQGQPGNSNPGWVAPAGNQGMWGTEQQRNGDRFSGQRDRGPQGGDPGFGGGRPWNRQSSFGRGGGPGGSSRPLSKGQRVCVYHENGHCKKGASCDYMHT